MNNTIIGLTQLLSHKPIWLPIEKERLRWNQRYMNPLVAKRVNSKILMRSTLHLEHQKYLHILCKTAKWS